MVSDKSSAVALQLPVDMDPVDVIDVSVVLPGNDRLSSPDTQSDTRIYRKIDSTAVFH